jgi:hypothetical protein
MPPINPPTSRFTHGIACLLLALLGGCGGGDGGSQQSAGDGALLAPASTALADNSAPAGVSFENFDVATVPTLTLDQYVFSGQHIYLKLSRPDGDLLFLGEIDPTQPYDLSVHLVPGDDRLRYEVFTESPLDDTVFGEILL